MSYPFVKKPLQMEKNESGMIPVLSVSPVKQDHTLLQGILNRRESKWVLNKRATLRSALTTLRQRRFPIVICECDLLPGSWKAVLEQLSRDPVHPYLIVTSRLADDRLWAEALNLGAYDVLAKPFDSQEVSRVVDSAWHHWRNTNFGGTGAVPEPLPAAAGM
ncbi:MAG TPA: response regulator [Bryobacteraceae bacterium]|nr:response regulator [Bryobacteraceae bacterium]